MSHGTQLHELPVRELGAAPRFATLGAVVLALIGAVAFVAALLADPTRAYLAYLQNWLFFTALAQGAFMLSVLVTIAKGMWSRPLRRFSLAFVAFMPLAFLLMIPILLGAEHIFPWIEHPVAGKEAYLNVPFMWTRQLLLMGGLVILDLAFAYWALRPDMGLWKAAAPAHARALTERLTRNWRGQEAEELLAHKRLSVLAPIVTLVWAMAFTVVSWDFIMSLEPYWFSTLLGPFVFMGGFLGGLAATGLLTLYMRERHELEHWILPTTMHDLAKLNFGFVVFWAYLFFSQYIVIWYGMLPLEQSYVVHRFDEPFNVVAKLAGVMVFVIPFFGLLGVAPKKNPRIYSFLVSILLVGLWLERYLLVHPSIYHELDQVPFGWQEIGIGLGFLGVLLGAVFFFLSRVPLMQLWIPRSELELQGVVLESHQTADESGVDY